MREILDKVTRQEAATIVELDAPTKAYNNADNKELYYVALNTWFNLVDHYSHKAYVLLHRLVMKEGLLATVGKCQELADAIINGISIEKSTLFVVCAEVTREHGLKHTLEILRFLKRISPTECGHLEDQAVKGFWSVEKHNKNLDRSESPWYLIQAMKTILSQMEISLNEMDCYFSQGTARDTKSTAKAPKIISSMAFDPELWFGYTTVSPADDKPSYFEKANPIIPLNQRRKKYSQGNLVNKSYKSLRFIAMEDAWRQYRMQSVRAALQHSMEVTSYHFGGREFSLSDFIHLEDQQDNQYKAALGVLGNPLTATIDLSHASDSVRESVVRSVFSQEVVRYLCEWKCNCIEFAGTKKTLYMFSTAGSALTFIIEALIFLSVVLVASQYYTALTGDDIDYSLIGVYGDDIVCPVEIADMVIEFLGKLGFTVNEEKSFTGETNYREACGEEYWKNPMTNEVQCVSGIYFPRHTFKLSKKVCEDITALASLQHRVFEAWPACLWVTDYVLAKEPSMTFSEQYTECEDLWDDGMHPLKLVPKQRFEIDNGKFRCLGDSEVMEEVHWHTKLVYSGRPVSTNISEQCDLRMEENYDLYKYYRFLQRGPSFVEDDTVLGLKAYGGLSFYEKNGISIQPVPYKHASRNFTMVATTK